ncbi:MAG: hypothetical protein CME70_18260 [Halobacteriovorax sp.]|nr:hypothetical protein [Halobacteriovorax sp.]|tara:strand:- start:7441 stop:8124 length:684 start_codon:yes stop_codon:yes gene_type:complete
MGSGGSSTSQQQAENVLGTLSPLLPVIGQIMGLSPITHKGAFQWGDAIPDFMGQGGILEGFNPRGLFDPAVVPTPQVDVAGSLGAAQSALGSMSDIARGGGVDEDVNLANIILTQRQLPALKEEMGAGLGLGPGDSDFNARLADIMGQNAATIASLGTERKMQAGQLVPSMAGNLFNLQGGASQIMAGRDPNRAMLNTLKDIAGFGTQAGGMGESSGKSSSWEFGLG